MNFKSEYFCLVIVGNWNNAIFTKEWVSKYLFNDKELNIEFPQNSMGASPRFSTKDLRVSVLNNRLNIAVINSKDEVFGMIEDLALKVVDYLLHTPVNAFGINFAFQVEINETINRLFISEDNTLLSNEGYILEKSQIVRRYRTENYEMTLTINKFEEFCELDFNYNYRIESLLDFKSLLVPGSVISFKNESLDILAGLYGLKIK